jgi:outer membrane protein insertion porin family
MNLKYTLAYREAKGIDYYSAAPAVLKEEGSDIKSALSATYTYDDLDNPLKPTSGLRGQIETEVAGLGGDDQYASIEGHIWWFFPFFDDKVVLKLEANAGHIEGFGKNGVPLQDRFYKGADSFRGFAKSGIGPMQVGNDGLTDAIGASTYAIGTAEVIFPLFGIPEQWGLEGVVFSDFGTVFGTDEDSLAHTVGGLCDGNVADGGTFAGDCTVYDSSSLRASIGAGLIWQSPFGPLRMEAAYPLVKEDTDKTEKFRFSVGTRF